MSSTDDEWEEEVVRGKEGQVNMVGFDLAQSGLSTEKDDGWMDDEAEVNPEREACKAAFQRLTEVILEDWPFPKLTRSPVFDTRMKNIPNHITEKQIISKLKKEFPEAFNHEDLFCKKFDLHESRNGKEIIISSAVVSGGRGQLRDVQRRSVKKYIRSGGVPYGYVFVPDFGEERDDSGKRVNPAAGTAYHVLNAREGPKKRDGLRLFSSSFLQLLPESLLNFVGVSTVFTSNRTFYTQHVPEQGIYYVQGGNVRVKRIVCASTLETMQLIRKKNNLVLGGERLIFQNQDGSIKSSCSDHRGLGLDGAMLIFDEFTHSIPLAWIDPKIKNQEFINSFALKCYRCKEPYILVQTSINLEYLFGKCSCSGPYLSYEDWNIRQVPNDSPYHYPGEVHTRLSYQLSDAPDCPLVAVPFLPKMVTTYGSVYMMINVLLPILESEWRAVRDFTKSHYREATVVFEEKFEKTGERTERRILHMNVPPTKFWALHKSTGFKSVTIVCDVKVLRKDDLIRTTLKGSLRKVSRQDPNNLRLLYEVDWNKEYELVGQVVLLTPKADKKEYEYCRKYLNKLPERFIDPEKSTIISDLFIEIDSSITLPVSELVSAYDFTGVVLEIFSALNPEQKHAFIESMASGLNIIQGPPGTGKSFLACSIALVLALICPGIIVCTAASNIACDVMYEQIQKLIDKHRHKFNREISVCRVFSRGKEIMLRRGEDDNEGALTYTRSGTRMRALHNLVAADEYYGVGNQEIEQIVKLIEKGEEYKLTPGQRKNFWKHVQGIERRLLPKEKIVIITTGALTSYRLGKLASEAAKDKEDEEVTSIPNITVSAVLVDEAGVQQMPSTLTLEALGAPLMTLIGDHLQLPPHVLSKSAENAGLNRSVMELLVVDRQLVIVPMTMLKEQFRAHSSLRELTSTVTYNELLRDADCIGARIEVLKPDLFTEFPKLSKTNRIWVRHHCGRERRVDKTFANDSEADIVIRTVTDFVWGRFMKQEDIVVLTPYEGQKTLLQKRLKETGYGDVQCKTVDEYQGSESVVVVLSFVRSNAEIELGFLMVANRVNVFISRAREVMVLCMNLAMLKTFEKSRSHLGKFFNFLVDRKLYTNEFVISKEDKLPNMQYLD